MSVNPKSPPGAPPLLKNVATAPVIYFDAVPVFGANVGGIQVELAATMLMPGRTGDVAMDLACTAHLRCTPQAAILLRDTLSKALDMLTPAEETSPLLKN